MMISKTHLDIQVFSIDLLRTLNRSLKTSSCKSY